MPSQSSLRQRRMTVPDPNRSRCTRRQTASPRARCPKQQQFETFAFRSASDVVQKLQPNETKRGRVQWTAFSTYAKERGILVCWQRERQRERETACKCSSDFEQVATARRWMLQCETFEKFYKSRWTLRLGRSLNCGPKPATAAEAAAAAATAATPRAAAAAAATATATAAAAILLQRCSLGATLRIWELEN